MNLFCFQIDFVVEGRVCRNYWNLLWFQGREPIRHCRKDKQCEKGKFCYRQMGTCHACRWGGQLCKRNHMCCKGYACVAGFCKPIQQSGAEGSFCRKTKDCQRGLCCTKTTIGQKVCRRFLKEGDACNLIESSFFRSANYCACGAGLKCKKVRRISNRFVIWSDLLKNSTLLNTHYTVRLSIFHAERLYKHVIFAKQSKLAWQCLQSIALTNPVFACVDCSDDIANPVSFFILN